MSEQAQREYSTGEAKVKTTLFFLGLLFLGLLLIITAVATWSVATMSGAVLKLSFMCIGIILLRIATSTSTHDFVKKGDFD